MIVLQTRGLKKVYGTGEARVRALDGVNLSVEEGEFAAIVGTSGSGKSTLLHMMGGLDSLLSIVQMPSGIPVATVGVNGGENAGLLAVQILALRYPELGAKLKQFKKSMAEKINADDAALQEELKA